jgi:hypothetical protein
VAKGQQIIGRAALGPGFCGAVGESAWQEAVVPPLLPAHVHVHGPLPVTVEAVPALHRLVVGAVLVVSPFADPHTPLTAEEDSGAEQLAVVPPLLPAHVHVHAPAPLTAEARPVVHRLLEGAELTATPLALPHEPLISSCAEQLAVVPPLLPAHVHDHGPVPLTAEAVPVLQRFTVGALLTATPLAAPHTPLIGGTSRGAEQLAVVPPLLPAHVYDHGPLPVTVDAVPALQRFAAGAPLTATPLAGPQEPLISRKAEQEAVDPPFDPAQLHVHGPLPVTAEAVPALQRLIVGALVRSAPFEEPQTPFTGDALATLKVAVPLP